jgi:GT2 family glycosyltransferase
MLSVVIPTRDRQGTLLETLRSLQGQRPPDGFEVIVVDNGSGDDTVDLVEDFRTSSPISVELVSEVQPGPARARNAGVAAASGELLLFLGDDTSPAGEGILARHLELHAERPDWRYAIQGKATWTPNEEVTPFMEWLERSGLQFNFDQLPPGRVPAVGAFCTAHVSMKRRLFDESGGFDVRFPWAALEDVELAVRLERLGIDLEYRPELVVLHDHPTTLDDSLTRWKRIGRSSVLLHQAQPEWDRREFRRPEGLRWRLLEWTVPGWRLLAHMPLPRRLREQVWRIAHLAAYARGYRDGRHEEPARTAS